MILRHFKISLFTLSCIFLFYLLNIPYNWDLFETVIQFLENLEPYELDEVVFALPILMIAIIGDILRVVRMTKRKKTMAEERMKTLQATMHNVQDIVNNFLNGINYYKLLAEEQDLLPEKELQELNDLIQKTTKKLSQLGDLKEVSIKESPFCQLEVTDSSITKPRNLEEAV